VKSAARYGLIFVIDQPSVEVCLEGY